MRIGGHRLGGSWGQDRRSKFRFLYFPPILWLGIFFLLPLVLMLAFSFRANMSGELFQLWTPTFSQYAQLIKAGSYWRLLGISAIMALGAATAAVILSYPIASFLAFRVGARAAFYPSLLLGPLWTSYILRA